MVVEGRRPVVEASIRAWRFVPEPEIKTVIVVGGGADAFGIVSAMMLII